MIKFSFIFALFIGLILANDAYANDELVQKFSECVLPKIQYGQYSSFDGGKSAMALTEECPHEASDLIEECLTRGDTRANCDLKTVMLVQSAIKMFGK